MKKIILCTTLAVLFPLTSAYAENFSKEVVIKKSLRWMTENQSISRVELEKMQDVVYTPEELFFEVLKVLRDEKPAQDIGYSSLYNLVKAELEVAKKFAQEIADLTDVLELTDAQKNKINSLLALTYAPNNAVFEVNKEEPAPVSITQIIKLAQDSINSLPFPSGIKTKMLGTIDSVKKVLLDSLKDDDCYNTSSGCQFSSNKGIVQYYSTRITQNHELALAVLKMGIRINHLNRKNATMLGRAPLYNDKTTLNLWPLFLDASGGDATLALEVMSVFGHDVMANTLSTRKSFQFLTSILNTFRPSQYGGDENPKSMMFLPGALNGILPSKRVIEKLDVAIAFYTKVYGKAPVALRHGYHHVYGGVLMAQQILADGNGQMATIDLASYVSEVMGYAYKKLQLVRYLNTDGLALWKAMQENEFEKPVKPEKWDQVRFDKAWAELQYHIAIMDYTENQHLIGSRFAMKVYQDKIK